jgi:DNA-binding NarL/FixJ family response regulator
MTKVRVVLADDHPMYRYGVAAVLATADEIARRLGMTDKMVRNHVSAILMKLQVTDRTAAAIKARDAR